ncbi:hypothetical protein AAMO2058_001167000 [Amorphochlora amoebiformis]
MSGARPLSGFPASNLDNIEPQDSGLVTKSQEDGSEELGLTQPSSLESDTGREAEPGEEMENLFVDVTAAPRTKRRWIVGIFCVFMVAVIWAGASVLVQYIFQARDFRKPFFLTWVCNSLFALNLPVWVIMLKLGIVSDVPNGLRALFGHYDNITSRPVQASGRAMDANTATMNNYSNANAIGTQDAKVEIEPSRNRAKGNTRSAASRRKALDDEQDAEDSDSESSPLVFGNGSQHPEQSLNAGSTQPNTTQLHMSPDSYYNSSPGNRLWREDNDGGRGSAAAKTKAEIAIISLIICPMWFLANWTYNLSLAMTSVTSSTVISNTSTLWTFILSLFILGERFRLLKFLGVACCIAGNVWVTFGDSKHEDGAGQTTFGDFVCTFSAFMYGMYTVNIRKRIPDEAAVPLPLFFGFLGAFNLVILAPFVLILHFTGVENLSTLSGETLGLIISKGILDNVISDYLWALAVLLTTPTVATIGLSLTIPLAILSDLFIKGILPSLASLGGAAFVIIGFLVINLASTPPSTNPPPTPPQSRRLHRALPSAPRLGNMCACTLGVWVVFVCLWVCFGDVIVLGLKVFGACLI